MLLNQIFTTLCALNGLYVAEAITRLKPFQTMQDKRLQWKQFVQVCITEKQHTLVYSTPTHFPIYLSVEYQQTRRSKHSILLSTTVRRKCQFNRQINCMNTSNNMYLREREKVKDVFVYFKLSLSLFKARIKS